MVVSSFLFSFADVFDVHLVQKFRIITVEHFYISAEKKHIFGPWKNDYVLCDRDVTI